MIVYITIVDDRTVLIRARAEGDDGTVGHLVQYISEGQSLLGIPYDVLRSAAPGQMEIPPGD